MYPSSRDHYLVIPLKDGGLTAWGTTLGAYVEWAQKRSQSLTNSYWRRWGMLFCAFGLTNSHGVYQDYYVRVHLSNYAPSTIGWIGLFQVFLGASGQLILHRPSQFVLTFYFCRVCYGSHSGIIVRQGVFLSDNFRIFVIIPLFVRWHLTVYDVI